MHRNITVLGVLLNRKGLFPCIHMSKFGGPGGEAALIDYSEYRHTQKETSSRAIKFSLPWLITCNITCYKPSKVHPKVI